MYVYDRKKFWNGEWKREKSSQIYPYDLAEILRKYDHNEGVGKVILDLGCGPNPVSSALNLKKHKRILVDLSKHIHELKVLEDSLITLEYDLSSNNNYQAYKEVLISLNSGLDAIVAANIINYIPWRTVFKRFNKDLKEDGLIFLNYGVHSGYKCAFSPEHPRKFGEVKNFFKNELKHTIIEYKQPQDIVDNMILVTKKNLFI